MIIPLLKKLPLAQKIVALINHDFTLLGEAQRVALEDETQQLEAFAQLIEVGRANPGILARIAPALHRLDEAVLQITKELKGASQEMVSAHAPALHRLDDAALMERNVLARGRLQAVLADASARNNWPSGHHKLAGVPIDVIVSANEVNQRHGTGILIQKIFGDSPNVVSIRSRNDYAGEHHFGAANFCLLEPDLRRSEVIAEVAGWLLGLDVRRVICVPNLRDDLIVAIAVKESLRY